MPHSDRIPIRPCDLNGRPHSEYARLPISLLAAPSVVQDATGSLFSGVARRV